MFMVPELMDAATRILGYEVYCDACQYGTAWRKRTRFLVVL